MRSLVALTASFVIVLGLAASLAAATWHIKDDGSGDAATIAAAVQAAAAGDTILLANGTYSGTGNRDITLYTKPLTICSESGDPALCIIDCGGNASENHAAFDIRAGGSPSIVLKDLTIRGGYGPSGGAIYITKYLTGNVTVDIENCVFTENTSVWAGGAILVMMDCTVNLTGCSFIDNSATEGGALVQAEGSFASVTACAFSGNHTQYGGAVYFGYAGTTAATGSYTSCSFLGNTATKYGGAFYAESGSPVFNGCSFSGNSADWSGGAVYLGGGMSMTRCSSIRNRALYDGSSIYCAAAQPIQITSCTFVADSLGGSVIACLSNVSPVLDRTLIAFAKSASAIYCGGGSPGTPTLTNCDIYGNQFGDWTGCIAGQAGINGNISLDPRFCNLTTGDISVADCSKCLAANNDDGQNIGSDWDAGCSCAQATEPATWGGLKDLFKK
jgi:predicted outer membrane repeat protein